MRIDKGSSAALSDLLLALADDELILGHRDSEWCGCAPILEEDIAFANIALDEIGHAMLWYGLLSQLQAQDPDSYPDRLVFTRFPDEFRNIQMVELPNGDWAFSMLRQFLFDAAEAVRLASFVMSQFTPLAEIAAKIRKEEIYHYRHTHAWVRRLGLGTEESHMRMQKALDELWPYALQLFVPLPGEELLVEAGIILQNASHKAGWQERVRPVLEECKLSIPAVQTPDVNRTRHTPHLKLLVDDLQAVASLEPESEW